MRPETRGRSIVYPLEPTRQRPQPPSLVAYQHRHQTGQARLRLSHTNLPFTLKQDRHPYGKFFSPIVSILLLIPSIYVEGKSRKRNLYTGSGQAKPIIPHHPKTIAYVHAILHIHTYIDGGTSSVNAPTLRSGSRGLVDRLVRRHGGFEGLSAGLSMLGPEACRPFNDAWLIGMRSVTCTSGS